MRSIQAMRRQLRLSPKENAAPLTNGVSSLDRKDATKASTSQPVFAGLQVFRVNYGQYQLCQQMINKIGLLLCGFLFAFVHPAHAGFVSGQDLLDGFSAAARVDATGGSPSDVVRAARTAGYIQGTIDSAISAGIFCLKGKSLTIRLAQPVIVQYLNKNPGRLKEAAVETVVLALHPAYKCDK